jgi:hypothetical protein
VINQLLDLPSWQEPILFACERMSRAGESPVDAVAAAIIDALSIDPMLAAEMIYRSSAAAWDKVRDVVVAFANRWHAKGMVDRAARFMITTGKSEFASLMWPLIASPDDQIYLAALRAADRFRPGVLGEDAPERLMALRDELRKTVLGEIASNSGIEGMELAADLAKADTNPEVQFSVVEALQFRRSDRLVSDVLQAANPAVWSFLAERGYAGEMADPDIAARLRAEIQSAIEKEIDPLRRLRLLLHSDGEPTEIGSRIEALIAAADFPFDEQNAYPNVYEAFKGHSREVTAALRRRLESGLELPFHSSEFLADAPLVDDGPIVTVAIDPDKPQGVACAAARIIGPNSVGTLIGAFLLLRQTLQASGETWPTGEVEKLHNLRDRIRLTRQEAFTAAWLCLSETGDSATIATLCDLPAMHGRDTGEVGSPPITGTHRSKLVATCQRMAEALLASCRSTRHDFEKMAQAIERVASQELTAVLGRLLAEDLKRWRASREARSRQVATVMLTAGSDAIISYTPRYARAFAAIGGDKAIELMKGYLADPLFGYDAAVALKEIWDNQHERPANKLPFGSTDFAAVRARREERGAGAEEPSPTGEAIFAVVEELLEVGRSEADHGQALRLARIAFSVPCAGKSGLMARLLGLSLPIESKLDLLTVLVLRGEIVSADLVLEGVRDFLEPAEGKFWSIEQRKWVLQRWLELLPFSDRPAATLEALELVPPNLRRGWEVRGVLSALAHAPDPDSERILAEMARRDASLLGDYQWVSAVIGRGTKSACLMLFDLRCDENLGSSSAKLDTWTISTELASLIITFPHLRDELIRRYQDPMLSACHSLIEQVLAKNPDSRALLALVQNYAAKNRGFDGSLRFAIEEAALEKRPVSPSSGSYELHPVAVPELRKQLFEMTGGEGGPARLASASLTTIDELRDERGRAASERRHPDIGSGRPWPPEAVA